MDTMTKPQFLAGWMLLTAQPWGKAYRTNTPEATIQIELYYKHVSRANPVVWVAVCEHAAQGDKWPSLSDLKASLANNGGYAHGRTLALPDHTQGGEAPWPLHACWTYQREHGCTFAEAVLAVLPVWARENERHEDYHSALKLLNEARANFGIPQTTQRGNIITTVNV